MKWVTVFPLALLAVAALTLAACGDDADDGTPSPVLTPTTTPDSADNPIPVVKVPAGEEPLTVARLDLAARLRLDPVKIQLSHARPAGWNGCLGVTRPETACTEIFVSGLIAWFKVDRAGDLYRYHVSGDLVIATDFVPDDAIINDGSRLPDGIFADVHARFAAYSRDDLALRLQLTREDIAVTAIVPTLFNDSCIGFAHDDLRGCDDALTSGAIVLLDAAGKVYVYHVADVGFVATNFADGTVTETPDASLVSVQHEMRKDLAERLGIPTEATSVNSFREVTWPTGCLGVEREEQLCTQALVDGFLAELTDGEDVYRYHGAGGQFIAASFEDDVLTTISDPLPRGE